ncbi:hypothetical protein [Streptomyces sp. enrichment culture]|uniref:hypothetical protein n=1 Tax=Streptomyces sp. enrichment culture TaxID=1795815 RepID=UPI003F55D47E
MSAAQDVPPRDYQLMLPDGWFRILLDPRHRERSVKALVNKRFSGADDAPNLRRQLQQELLHQATKAYEEGGIELYISLQRAGALTIPASLLITLVPARNAESALPSPQALADELQGTESDGRSVSVVELAAGTAVRVRVDPVEGRTQATIGDALPSVTVTYQLRVPGSEAHLLLSFSTPLVKIADAMVELFDAVAGSLVWKE